MQSFSQVAGSLGPTTLFVLLWSSGALFARWGLDHASPFAFLCMRFGLALAVLTLVSLRRGAWWPRTGTRGLTAATGAVLVGGYSVFYLLALDRGVTPGLLATILGVQPLATLACTERPLQRKRFAGLGLALAGLAMVVLDSLLAARAAPMGLACALLALGCMTAGTLMQKRLQQSPLEVLPLQYTVALAMCAALLPLEAVRVEWSAGLLVTVGWLGVVISVVATLLLYRLIAAGNLVNVTSLFYLVPAGTAALDWLVFGHTMAPVALLGTGAVLAGLVLVYRTPAATTG
ncbi:MAG: family transporter [Ramlibacter sp.]|jgi:drug/metabolite transporter (DMT)-like permease|nr:family transporter [Ramlibacter sp.]